MSTCLNCGHTSSAEFQFCPECGTRALAGGDPGDSLLGHTLNDKYRVMTEIGAGAMGTVYLGEHIGLKKKVALKVLHPDMRVTEETLQRFQREGIAAGKFSHPHLIQIFDFDQADGDTFYLAMEYVEGSNLKVFLRRKKRLPVAVALRLARQLLSVLAEAHRHGIVHRDLKPDNIMVEAGSRGELRLKVLDFGLSKLLDAPTDESALRTEAGRIMGTPLYMSPEQCAGEEADERSDIYAAGLILYEMVAGIRPFREESTTDLLIKRATSEAPSISVDHPEVEIPEELDLAIARALARRREDRFQSAEDMLEALAMIQTLEGAATTTSATRTQLALRMRDEGRLQSAGGAKEASGKGGANRKRIGVAIGIVVLAVAAVLFNQFGGSVGIGSRPARISLIADGDRTEEESRYLGYLEEARAALRGGDLSAAQTAIDAAFGMSCRDAEFFHARGTYFHLKRDVDPALEDLREAIEMDPAYLEPRLAEGWIHLEHGRLEDARASFDGAAELAPEDGDVAAARGALAFETGDVETAEPLLVEALERAPDSARAALYVGRLRLDAGDVEGAIQSLVRAKRNDSRAWRSYAWLAEAYLAQERFDLAESQLREVLEIRPELPEVRERLAALLLNRERFADAATLLEESVRAHPEAGRLFVLLGVAQEAEGRLDDAVDSLEQGVRRLDGDAEALELLGLLYHRTDRLAEAAETYERVVDLDGTRVLPHLNLGLALFALERVEEAAPHFERVLELAPNDLTAHLHLGLLHMDYLGDTTKAVEHFRSYREGGGGDARVSGWLRRLGG